MYNLTTKKNNYAVGTPTIFDDVFGDFFKDSFLVNRPRRTTPLSNLIRSNSFYNVDETETDINIKVNVPSFDDNLTKEDIDVSYDGDTLTVQSNNEDSEEVKSNTPNRFYLQYRVRSSDYQIDSSKIEASLKGNILTVKLPKIETVDESVLKIEVK